MSTASVWKRMLGASAIAMLFGAIPAQAQTPQAATSTSASALGRADQRLVTELAQTNLAEIEAAKVAQGKTQNQEVKNFAQKMIDDHTKALQEVQQLAQAKGLTLPTEPDSTHKKMQQKLATLSGDAFDRQYVAQSGVSDHKKAHALLQRVQAKAKDADLKALAAKLQPTVDQHLSSVQQMNANMKASGKKSSGTAAGSSGTSGTQGGSGTPKTGS